MDLLAEIDPLVDVGRRAPGSDAERRAARHLEERLRELGREAESEPVDAWPGWPLAYAILAAVAVAASVLSISVPGAATALAFVAALLTFLDAGMLIPTLRRALGRRASQNVVSWGDLARPGALILVAHYDAGRGGVALGERATKLRARLGRLIRRPIGGVEPVFWAEMAVLVCCLLRLLGIGGTVLTVLQFIPTAALILASALLLDIALSGTKGGENDNASGTAVALALAERFRGSPLEHFGVHVLFTGAQKAGSAGMRAFLARHRTALGRDRTVFLNVDAVGSGQVRYTRREGALLPIRSHLQVVKLCEEIAEDDVDQEAFGARRVTSRSASDGYAARLAGFPAITITCRGRLDHVPARVDEAALRRAEGFCVELIERLDAEIGPDLARPVEETVLSEAEET